MSQDETLAGKKKKGRGGRPPLLTPFKLQKTKELVEDGKKPREVADILGVSRQTITNWKSMSEEFLATYNEAEHKANQAVKAALFNKATGYTIEKTNITYDLEGNKRTIIEEVYYPPDTQAQQFWLKNRDPENFKDKTEQHITGTMNQNVVTETPEEQLERIKAMLKDDLK